MGTVARWGSKKFVISRSKINPIYDFSSSYAMKEDSNSDTSGNKKTNTRGRQPEEPSFSVDYVAGVGCKPRTEITNWRANVGKKEYLYIGKSQYGKNRFELKTVDLSDILLDSNGRMTKGTVTLTFLEILPKKKSKKSSKKGAKSAKPSKDDAKKKSPYKGKGKK